MAAPPPSQHYVPGLGHHRLTPLYDLVTRLLGARSLHRELLRQAAVQAHQRVLEIGCGTGNLALRTKRTHAEADVVGIDPDAAAVRLAHRKATRTRADIHWDVGLAQHLPYPDDSFDRVLSALMLHHLDAEARRAALREARRVLAPRGSLHVVDLGGRSDASQGVIARTLAHAPRLAGIDAGVIVADLENAGFGGVAQVNHRVSRVLGPITFYRADAS